MISFQDVVFETLASKVLVSFDVQQVAANSRDFCSIAEGSLSLLCFLSIVTICSYVWIAICGVSLLDIDVTNTDVTVTPTTQCTLISEMLKAPHISIFHQ